MSASPVRSVITIFMNLLILLSVLLVVRMVVLFFGALDAQSWGQAIVKVSNLTVVPFGVEDVVTQFGGVFDVDAGLTVAVFLLGEWALNTARGRA